jgi:trimethylamine:corrinoid methyltransferase-like protein
MLEYVINRHSDISKFLDNILPFLFLKQKQALIMIEIINKKRNISNQSDFNNLVRLKEVLQNLNYSNQ